MTAADKPRGGRYTGTRGDGGWTPCWECKRPHDEHRLAPAGAGDALSCPTDKPRADLVALFDAVAALPAAADGSGADLCLFGNARGAALRAWAARHAHRVDDRPLYTPHAGGWIYIWVTLPGGRIGVHLDGVTLCKEQPEAAEGSV